MKFEVRNMISGYLSESGFVKIIDDLSFELMDGEILGISGESGSGKTTLLYSIFNSLSYPGYILEGKVEIDNRDMFKMTEEELRKVRGEFISFVPQGTQNSLNPVKKIIDQFLDIIESHEREMNTEDLHRVLDIVHLGYDVLYRYPHEISGGMKQRVIIAMALLYSPKIIIMDEPTTGLDVLVQYEILKTIKEIQKKLSLSIIIVTHDISVLFQISDRVLVLYGGNIMEMGSYKALLTDAKHPYTKLLLDSIPTMSKSINKLNPIPGEPLNFSEKPKGCVFSARCPFVINECRERRPILIEEDGTKFSCIRYPDWKKEAINNARSRA